ncbi:TetR/AcrR family transcriptional regulator [Nocardia niwae]|uniref:TetR family transcriptional regulator n=1 Tax=Nocardia niwae TaxID=626084 RepID=A0ABV2X715_9NOCA|nr:TetR family transcriptional regulator [Nocardia niwae]
MTAPHQHDDAAGAAPHRANRGGRGAYAKSPARRREIVTAAIEVFSQRGFRDGSLRDVAERAGITLSGVRHHFPAKVDLLQAVLRQREDDSLAKGDRIRAEGLDAVRNWIEAVAENVAEPVLVELEFVLAGEAVSTDHPAHDHFVRMQSKSETILKRAFIRMQEQGRLRDSIDPARAARTFLAVTQGVQSLWLRDRSIDIAEVLHAQLDAMLRAPDAE